VPGSPAGGEETTLTLNLGPSGKVLGGLKRVCAVMAEALLHQESHGIIPSVTLDYHRELSLGRRLSRLRPGARAARLELTRQAKEARAERSHIERGIRILLEHSRQVLLFKPLDLSRCVLEFISRFRPKAGGFLSDAVRLAVYTYKPRLITVTITLTNQELAAAGMDRLDIAVPQATEGHPVRHGRL